MPGDLTGNTADAQRVLVLLPGLDGTGILFRPLLPHLPSTIRPIVISYPPDQSLNYAQLLEIALKELPKEPFIILGESFSSVLALMIAARHPDHLRGIILCAGFARSPLRFHLPGLKHLAKPLVFRLYKPVSRIRARLSRNCDAAVRELFVQALADVKPSVLANRIRAVLQVDVTNELANCSVPILYLRGDRDHVVPGHNCAQMQQVFPAMRVADFHTSHWILQLQPQKAADAIAQFAAST
jgi:pimeloyl-[acyl-carrier protein] methyl ester esterase